MSKTQDASNNAANATAAGMMGLGDLTVIRNILFGQQAAEFESKLDATTARLDRTDEATRQQFEKLEKEIRTALAELAASIDNRLRQLENKLDETAARLADDIRKSSIDDRAAVGKLLIEIGQKLS